MKKLCWMLFACAVACGPTDATTNPTAPTPASGATVPPSPNPTVPPTAPATVPPSSTVPPTAPATVPPSSNPTVPPTEPTTVPPPTEPICFSDEDGDGFGTAVEVACGVGAASQAGDCDDTDASLHPDADEVCDDRDNDCDNLVDNGLPLVDVFVDADGDGAGAEGSTPVQQCAPGEGQAANDLDCDDANSAVQPQAVEACNHIDDNCDGMVDEGVTVVDFADIDGDGIASAEPTTICPDQVVAGPGGDCDDNNALVGIGQPTFIDDDMDGFGDVNAPADVECVLGAGRSYSNTDCNDSDFDVNPDAPEVCNEVDDNCNAAVDEGVLMMGFRDADGDGLGSGVSGSFCAVADNADDCDDLNPTVGGPGTFYTDEDGDGAAGTVVMACDADPSWSSVQTDCDDDDSARFPGAADLCDGVDADCSGGHDGLIDVSSDGVTWSTHDGDLFSGLENPFIRLCPSSDPYPLEGDLRGLFSRSLSIQGPGFPTSEKPVIEQVGSSRIFRLDDNHLELHDVDLQGTPGPAFWFGGCMTVAGSELLLDNVDIRGCRAGIGGAVMNATRSTITVVDSEWVGVPDSAEAVHFGASTATMINTIVRDFDNDSEGGAIHMHTSDLTLVDSQILNNHADRGASVYVWLGSVLTASNTHFETSGSDVNVWVENAIEGGGSTFTNCTFEGSRNLVLRDEAEVTLTGGMVTATLSGADVSDLSVLQVDGVSWDTPADVRHGTNGSSTDIDDLGYLCDAVGCVSVL